MDVIVLFFSCSSLSSVPSNPHSSSSYSCLSSASISSFSISIWLLVLVFSSSIPLLFPTAHPLSPLLSAGDSSSFSSSLVLLIPLFLYMYTSLIAHALVLFSLFSHPYSPTLPPPHLHPAALGVGDFWLRRGPDQTSAWAKEQSCELLYLTAAAAGRHKTDAGRRCVHYGSG